MIVALPCCQSDLSLLRLNLEWMKSLGGCPNHEAMVIVDEGVNWDDATSILDMARAVFKGAVMLAPTEGWKGWPSGPNSMFLTAARYARKILQPFLFMEPDCVPIRTRWLEKLDEEYKRCGKPFMGALVKCDKPGLPGVSLAGNAVYPACALEIMEERIKLNQGMAFDISTSEQVVPLTAFNRLIQHFWGQPNLPPLFLNNRWPDSPRNTMTLDDLNPGAVLFHRDKFGALIRQLRRSLFPEAPSKEFTLVFPFCNKDGDIAVKLSEWIRNLGSVHSCDCLVSSDFDTLPKFVGRVIELLRPCFKTLDHFRYRAGSTRSWPDGANQAFRSVAFEMKKLGKPWLWIEADAIPVHRSWMEQLQTAYELCGKPFYGPIVPRMGHMNGVGVYPADTTDIIGPALFTPPHIAWDSAMKDWMIHLCCDAEPVIQHVWGIVNGQPHPITGQAPVFSNTQQVKDWVNPQAAIFHRCKDGSLIDRLSEIKKIK